MNFILSKKIRIIFLLISTNLALNATFDWNNPKQKIVPPSENIGTVRDFGVKVQLLDNKIFIYGCGDSYLSHVFIYEKNDQTWQNTALISTTFIKDISMSNDKKYFAVLALLPTMVWVVLIYSKDLSGNWDWSNPMTLNMPDPSPNSVFTSVTFSPDNEKFLAGASTADPNGKGAMWIYNKNTTSWDWDNPISVAAPASLPNNANFGYRIKFSEDSSILAVASKFDSVWIYKKSSGVWDWNNPIQLTPINRIGSNADFGSRIVFSPDSNTLAIQGLQDDTRGAIETIGAVWVYQRNSGVWNWNPTKLVPTNIIGNNEMFGGPNDEGALVFSEDGSTLAINGVDNYKIASGEYEGAVWIYQKNSGGWNWNPTKIISPFSSIQNKEFGVHTAFSKDNSTMLITTGISTFCDLPWPGDRHFYAYSKIAGIWELNNPITFSPPNNTCGTIASCGGFTGSFYPTPINFGDGLLIMRQSVTNNFDNTTGSVYVYGLLPTTTTQTVTSRPTIKPSTASRISSSITDAAMWVLSAFKN